MQPDETSWTLIDCARTGELDARDEFARRYVPIVQAYFEARWRGGSLANDVDDGVQEVFVDCLRPDGALGRSDPARLFRPFLYGVARTVALRFEQRRGKPQPTGIDGRELEDRESHLSVVFDRAFARQVMREATELQRQRAEAGGGLELRRFELLELRFQRGHSMAEIARLWNEKAARVHHLYAEAREDFRRALRDVVGRRHGGRSEGLERECDWMLEVLKRSS